MSLNLYLSILTLSFQINFRKDKCAHLTEYFNDINNNN